ncbi:TPA: hypothetical protein ACQVH3_004646 [Serratia marcescens]|nr:hypothetical protein [Serratia marcescens]
MTNKEIAQNILTQLGGNRLIAMTGAKNFVAIDRGLQFDLPKKAHFVKNGITRLHIVLDASDTYTIKAFKIRGMNVTEVSESSMIYCDVLQATFTELTGLDTHL